MTANNEMGTGMNPWRQPSGWLDWESQIVEAQRRLGRQSEDWAITGLTEKESADFLAALGEAHPRGPDYDHLDTDEIHDAVIVDDDPDEPVDGQVDHPVDGVSLPPGPEGPVCGVCLRPVQRFTSHWRHAEVDE
jgi:hypothetical protein